MCLGMGSCKPARMPVEKGRCEPPQLTPWALFPPLSQCFNVAGRCGPHHWHRSAHAPCRSSDKPCFGRIKGSANLPATLAGETHVWATCLVRQAPSNASARRFDPPSAESRAPRQTYSSKTATWCHSAPEAHWGLRHSPPRATLKAACPSRSAWTVALCRQEPFSRGTRFSFAAEGARTFRVVPLSHSSTRCTSRFCPWTQKPPFFRPTTTRA